MQMVQSDSLAKFAFSLLKTCGMSPFRKYQPLSTFLLRHKYKIFVKQWVNDRLMTTNCRMQYFRIIKICDPNAISWWEFDKIYEMKKTTLRMVSLNRGCLYEMPSFTLFSAKIDLIHVRKGFLFYCSFGFYPTFWWVCSFFQKFTKFICSTRKVFLSSYKWDRMTSISMTDLNFWFHLW